LVQEVKAGAPRPKKLFEWDPARKVLQIVAKGQMYTCLLGDDGLFRNISVKPKQEK